ncbi:MAG: hypothetical protein P4M11_02745 [Candidatus Pacebacteria bacterium]|nr:hypothetical protein [Candidatus Paceibacterota bacterium]
MEPAPRVRKRPDPDEDTKRPLPSLPSEFGPPPKPRIPARMSEADAAEINEKCRASVSFFKSGDLSGFLQSLDTLKEFQAAHPLAYIAPPRTPEVTVPNKLKLTDSGSEIVPPTCSVCEEFGRNVLFFSRRRGFAVKALASSVRLAPEEFVIVPKECVGGTNLLNFDRSKELQELTSRMARFYSTQKKKAMLFIETALYTSTSHTVYHARDITSGRAFSV